MTANGSDRPVLVVGAGPTGLTAALELSRLGVGVRLIDQAAQATTTSKALAVQARTIELLRPRGVGGAMLAAGTKARAASLYGRGRKLAEVELHRIPSRVNGVLLLPQSETERLLTEQVRRQGVEIEREVELASFSQDESGVRAVLKHPGGTGEVLDAAYLISAQGAHSSIRHDLGLSFDGNAIAQRYLLADLHLDGPVPDDELSIFLATEGFLALFPMSGRRFRLMATDPDPAASNSDVPTLPELQQIVDRVAPLSVRLRDITWSSRFFINSRHLSTLRVGNVFLGGDAAHIHSPAGGQGMNTGIQDMINLCWKLALVRNGHAKPELLDTYQADRLPLIKTLIRTTETATRAFNSTNPIVHQLITRIAPIALATDQVQNRATAMLGEIGVNYRDSPISKPGGRIGHLQAGDRLPDVDVTIAGEPAHLYDLLDLTRLTLLVTDPAADTEQLAPWQEILTIRHIAADTGEPDLPGPDRQFAADLKSHPGLLLIRPDAYVAAITNNPADLTTWLDTWFTTGKGASC